MTTIAGKTALITGSTQGLGLAAAKQLAAAGCNVVLHGLPDPDRFAALKTEFSLYHGVETVIAGVDLRDPDEIEGMISAAIRRFGAIDILVNNAVVRHTGPIEHFRADAWNESLAVNVSAAFHTIRLALPAMKARGWGRIVNISSIYGQRGAANRVGYVTTKTALIGLTRAVALEVVGTGVTCNAVCPGTTETPVHDATIDAIATRDGIARADAERKFLAGKQPTGRIIAADDVAALIVFLCGPQSRDINGSVLPIDAGWSAG
ncbi:MAG TPA: SDR family NAD(P)-dependent oxidoreductase [Vicinamibacterales bacterium]|nr:SDR family NAD(P)-dependent oxidoreductase [Vicinamibacterales bacterium]